MYKACKYVVIETTESASPVIHGVMGGGWVTEYRAQASGLGSGTALLINNPLTEYSSFRAVGIQPWNFMRHY